VFYTRIKKAAGRRFHFAEKLTFAALRAINPRSASYP
jgi:hypothetical protein